MIANPYSQYRDVQIQTASPGRLLVMLYDGAIRFCNDAKRGIAANDPRATYEGLRRAQDILDHLTATLDMGAGEIARNLASLYEFMGRRLLEANLRRDPQAIDDVIGLLQTVRSAYAEITAPAVKPGPATAPAAGTIAHAVSNLG